MEPKPETGNVDKNLGLDKLLAYETAYNAILLNEHRNKMYSNDILLSPVISASLTVTKKGLLAADVN